MSSRYENIQINKLAKVEHLSEWTYHICKKNNLLNLQQLLEYNRENGGFHTLKNCGSKPNQELIEICRKYDNQIVDNINAIENVSLKELSYIENVSLKELSYTENISVRTYNICKYNDLSDLKSIIQYFLKNGNFKKLRNCGNNSNQELIDICYKDKYSINSTSSTISILFQKNEITEIIEDLTIKQKAVLNNIISAKFNSLSQRSSNALIDYLHHNITIKNLKEYIFSNINFEISTLRNVGSKASVEINLFLKEIKEFIKLVSVFESEEDLTRELFNALLIKLFSVSPKTISKIGENYDFSDGIPVFKTINILIENDYIFKKNEKAIFKQSLGFFENIDPLTLDEISSRIGLTKERTRQIRNKLLDNFNQYFSFVSFLEKENLNFYSLDTTSLLLNIDQKFIEELSKNEMVNYNNFFINRILLTLLKDKYTLIGDEKKGVLRYSSRKHHNWSTTYLVSNQFQSMFDFEELINDVDIRLATKIEEDYKFHFQTYLLNFKKTDCFVHLDEISQIAEHILYNEFEIIIDSEDSINFARNSMKTMLDYIYETLKEANKPLTVYEIFDILNQQNPGISKSAEALRGSCQRDTRLMYFGRSSTYGLKTWEGKLENIKGGTMHDISEEFLLQFDEPKQIGEIVEYVKSFRNNVTSKNLFYNLKSAEHRRFVFFQNRFVGLVSKTYNTDLFPTVPKYYSNKKSWEENFQLLEIFTLENERLPYSSGNEEEVKLYRFFYLQVRKLTELGDTKKGLVENLIHKVNYQKRTRHNNKKRDKLYDKLLSFVQAHGRAPSMQIYSEQKLYGFFYRQRQFYKEKKLSNEYLSKFLEITETIKNNAR